jgi:predicted dehydrogenase
MASIGVAIIGAGGIALANHLPGIALCREARLVAVCDSDPATLERARRQTGAAIASSDWRDIVGHDAVDAVIICTPNHVHAPIVLAAVAAGKHVLCEKPIAMDAAEALAMWRAAEQRGVRHMTAFTYRFVPAMRYLAHLVAAGAIGQPRHFRVQRLQDWGTRNLGWRQQQRFAASGELGDMLSHRIDYAHLLVGPIARLSADTRQFVAERDGQPADVEDWVAILAAFANGATGVMESTKLATGCGEGKDSPDRCEVNGSEGTLVYQLGQPHHILRAAADDRGLQVEAVPAAFLCHPGSPRDPAAGDPLVTFRYDQAVEFIGAIRDDRPCVPSFAAGCAVQMVMDAALRAAAGRCWVDVAYPAH